MKLSYFSRISGKKSELQRLRREGGIPAVLYGQKQPPQSIFIKKDEMEVFLRHMKSGLLSTSVFELHHGERTHRAMIKEVQRHRTTYVIEHIDFIAVNDADLLTVNVPIQLVGAGDCIGVKLGGFLRQAIRSLRVSCLLKDLPTEFVFDVSAMQIADIKRLSDIVIPPGVCPKKVAKMNEVAVVVAKKV
jgi:large subunit ribosomal protein L25